MNEIDDICDVTEDVFIDSADIDSGEWEDFDSIDTSDVSNGNNLENIIAEVTEADKAAEYARSFGFDKAADYIGRHYDGDTFIPGEPIPITTRNMGLEGTTSNNGVPFDRRIAELAEGLSVEGVFPNFDSRYHVELGDDANEMTIHQQFNACKEDLQDHMYDTPDIVGDIPIGDMEKMDNPQGYTPEGFTWQHNPETGSFDLVSKDDHSVGHTGGNALWGVSKS